MNHDYAGCEIPACGLCDAFGDAWAQGKTKMRDEIVAAAAERRHAADCGCVPCAAVREVLRARGWRPRRALRREIEARRDAQLESHERLGNILETGTLFHHDDRADADADGDLDDDDRADAEAEAEAERAYQQSCRAPGD